MGDIDDLLRAGQYDEGQLADALLDTYYAPLYRLAFSILGDAAGTEDVVQETLLTAINKIKDYQPGTNLKSWLFRIAIYRCKDLQRKRAIREKWYTVWKRVAEMGTPPRTPEGTYADQALRGELWQAVNSLGNKHRLPIIMFYIHGMTAPEIAEVLNISRGTVYSRLFYAYRKLEDHLATENLEEWAEEYLNG